MAREKELRKKAPALDKFTGRALKVLALAAQECDRLRDDGIGTEHLLLAILKEKDGMGAQVLDSFGVDYKDALSQLNAFTGRNGAY